MKKIIGVPANPIWEENSLFEEDGSLPDISFLTLCLSFVALGVIVFLGGLWYVITQT